MSNSKPGELSLLGGRQGSSVAKLQILELVLFLSFHERSTLDFENSLQELGLIMAVFVVVS